MEEHTHHQGSKKQPGGEERSVSRIPGVVGLGLGLGLVLGLPVRVRCLHTLLDRPARASTVQASDHRPLLWNRGWPLLAPLRKVQQCFPSS